MKMERWMQERAAAAIEGCRLADDVPEYVLEFYKRISLVYQHIHNNKEMGQHISGPVIGIAIENMKLHERIAALEARMDRPVPVVGGTKKLKQDPATVGATRENPLGKRQPVGV